MPYQQGEQTKNSPNHAGTLSARQYRAIFSDTCGGRYGDTLDYAQQTHAALLALGIRDRSLAKLLAFAPSGGT